MCRPSGHSALAEFIRFVGRQQTPVRQSHLVLNGDIVDFLAEREFSSFTNDDSLASRKLQHIISSSTEVWESLRVFVRSGGRLTLLLGNHDTELSLPQPRRLLMETIGTGNVEFIYDNQAYTEGPVLIEHGNRYDAWNIVSHDAVRAIRSAMSRGEGPIKYLGPPGSQLVATAMNPIKERYPFVDLLKPEDSAMLPLLAVLDPASLRVLPRLTRLASQTWETTFDENGIPLDRQNIAASGADFAKSDESLDVALRLSGIKDIQDIGAAGTSLPFWDIWKTASDRAKDIQLNSLLSALRYFADKRIFDVGVEQPVYLKPAKAAAGRGYKVVVYGHTHLPKRIQLAPTNSIYLNSGTWADLMRLPQAIFGEDMDIARAKLRELLADLEAGRLDDWRCQVPTFARIDLSNGDVVQADIYLFDSTKEPSRISDGMLPFPGGRA